uniref:ELM2 domain-containing protein n=1 Tax=Strongyloides venezuelensis TaxID=75913 RepID=A0A0K0G118_STRVS
MNIPLEASSSKEKSVEGPSQRIRRSRRLGDVKNFPNDLDDPNFDTFRDRDGEKIHIGPLFQADIPDMLKKGEEDTMYDKFKNMEVLWDPKKLHVETLNSFEKMKLDGFLAAAEAYGIGYTDSLQILAQQNYDPLEACKYIESFEPYHYIKPFTKEEINVYNSMLRFSKEKRFKLVAAKIGRPLNEVVAYHYSMRKRSCHMCIPDTKVCTCFTVKKHYGDNIVKNRKDCLNCHGKLYADEKALPIKPNEIESIRLCKPCEIYIRYTGIWRRPVLEYNPSPPPTNNVDMEEKMEIVEQDGSLTTAEDDEENLCFYKTKSNHLISRNGRPNFPDDHMVKIIHEITNFGSDKDAILHALEKNYNITEYTKEDIEYFITFYSLDYNIPFLIEVAKTRQNVAANSTAAQNK